MSEAPRTGPNDVVAPPPLHEPITGPWNTQQGMRFRIALSAFVVVTGITDLVIRGTTGHAHLPWACAAGFGAGLFFWTFWNAAVVLGDRFSPEEKYRLSHQVMAGDGEKRDATQAGYWLQAAAEDGHALAQAELGWAFSYWGYAEHAVPWYKRAAEAGVADACVQFGWHLLHGVGVAKDEAEGMRWLRRAAELDDPDIWNYVGEVLYQQTPPAYDEGRALIVKAAEARHPRALANLGYIYGKGLGVARDEFLALTWYMAARALDVTLEEQEHAQLDEITAGRPQGDIVRAEKEATAWLEAHPPSA